MSENGQFSSYNIDVCLCIDKTGSMKPIMETVKKNALNLYSDILRSLEETERHISQFRIRVIWFGDYKADEEPMIVSPFLTLPDETRKFEEFVRSIAPEGGGDAPEDGLEALAYAIRSDWNTDGWKKRHIIALFTDAPAHELGYARDEPNYPKTGLPGNFGELTEMRGGDEDDPGEMDFHAKRLLLSAPETEVHPLFDRKSVQPAYQSAPEPAPIQPPLRPQADTPPDEEPSRDHTKDG